MVIEPTILSCPKCKHKYIGLITLSYNTFNGAKHTPINNYVECVTCQNVYREETAKCIKMLSSLWIRFYNNPRKDVMYFMPIKNHIHDIMNDIKTFDEEVEKEFNLYKEFIKNNLPPKQINSI